MSPDELKDAGVVLSAIAAIATALILMARHIRQGWRAVAGFFCDFGKMPSRIGGLSDATANLCKRVAAIEGEMKPNGGASFRDAIARVEQMTIGTRAHVRLQYQINHTPTFEVAINGAITWINRAYIEEYGMGLDDISGNKWVSNIHPDDRDRVVREWGHIVSDQRQGDIKYRGKFKGDDYSQVDIVVYPMFDHAAVCLGWIGYSKMLPK
jgi:PAS domain-containing protein